MASLKVFLFLICARHVFSDEGSLLKPCKLGDIECLSASTEQFLEKTCKGIPEYDIRAIDPLIVDSIDVTNGNTNGIILHFENLNITGLKNQQISDFQMNLTEKSVILKTKADLHIVSDITVESTKTSKTFTGSFTGDTSVIGAVSYGYELRLDSKGIQYFDVLPETFTCENIGKTKLVLDSKLLDLLKKDTDIDLRDEHLAGMSRATVCKIAQACYVNVVYNIRASAKILPASSFFEDLK